MRRGGTFWALVLILVGGLLLLENLNVLAFLHVSVWGLFWPFLLIALGVRILWGIGRGRTSLAVRDVAIPLEGAERARICVRHGAGHLQIGAGAAAEHLLSGSFRGGLDYSATRKGKLLDVEMRVPSDNAPFLVGPWHWGPAGALDWSVRLNGQVPLALDLQTGANETKVDLTELRVTDLSLETGASSTTVALPKAAGHTRVKVSAGAAAMKVRVPEGVAARIRLSGALSGSGVDTSRFPRSAGGYESPDYATAANQVEIDVDSALASVDVR